MEKVGRRVRSSQPRVKGALWTGYMRVNYKPFHKYKHISFTRPYNIAPHTHAHAHTHTKHGFKSILSATFFQSLQHSPRLVSLPHAFWSPSSFVHPTIFPYTSAAEPWEEKAHTEGMIPGWGRSPGGEHGNPLQYSCLKNPMDGGAWWATVHRITKSQTQLKQLSTYELWPEVGSHASI